MRSFRLATTVTVLLTATPTFAAPPKQSVHPIFVNVPDAPQNDLAMQRFDRATKRFAIGPIETVVIDAPPTPQVADRLKSGVTLVTKLDFGRGLATLDAVAADVATTGGGGLDATALADLYFHRAWAISRADFNPAHNPDPPTRTQAFSDFVRAATLDSHRVLNTKQYPPLVLEDWSLALADVRSRPQTTVTVQAAPEAFVTLDGGNPVRGPATFVGVAQGEHLVHVDEPTWAPWGATITTTTDAIELAVPERRALTLPDAEAAARAKRMGMDYALVAEPRPGLGGLSLSLRLVDQTGVRRDSAIAQIAGDDSALDAAVMRLDEQARKLALSASTDVGTAPPPTLELPPPSSVPPAVLTAPTPKARPTLSDDPGAWAREHWPLVTAVGVMVAATVILTIGISADR